MSDPAPIAVVTLHQPWASLILVGAKPFETRSWPPPARLIGGRLGIHAGLKLVRDLPAEIAAAVAGALGDDWADTVPRGRLLCTATLRGAWRTGTRGPSGSVATTEARAGSPTLASFADDPFGDYAPGRWIWGLSDVAPLLPHPPMKGRQGIWSCSITG